MRFNARQLGLEFFQTFKTACCVNRFHNVKWVENKALQGKKWRFCIAFKGLTKNSANDISFSEDSMVKLMSKSCMVLIPWEHTNQRTWTKSPIQKHRAMLMSFAEHMYVVVWRTFEKPEIYNFFASNLRLNI